MHATLHLDDGSQFKGYLFGATKSIQGEIGQLGSGTRNMVVKRNIESILS